MNVMILNCDSTGWAKSRAPSVAAEGAHFEHMN